MNPTDILDVLYTTMNACDGCCMDNSTDRETFANAFANYLARKQQELDGAKKRTKKRSGGK